MAARLRRQLLRKTSVKGQVPGLQLRRTLRELTGKNVEDGEILRALLDHGVLVDREELSRYLDSFRSPYTGLVSVCKFIEALEPGAYEFVFPTNKPCAGANLIAVKKEVKLSDRDTDPHMFEGECLGGKHRTKYTRIGHREVSDQEVRNCLRQALANRLATDGALSTNFFKELRECDTGHEGMIGQEQFKMFLFKMGLKVEAGGNLERLWRTMAGDADKMDLMRVSQILTSDFENVPRKSREKIRDHFEFR